VELATPIWVRKWNTFKLYTPFSYLKVVYYKPKETFEHASLSYA
jgi:hypothetical protein